MKVRNIFFGFVFSTLSALSAQSQVMIDISKVTCDQFVQGKIGEPRTLAAWLSGYYNGRKGNTIVDQQRFEDSLTTMQAFCRDAKNVKLPVMQAIESVLGPGK